VNTPRFKFSVVPAALAMLIGFLAMPVLNVVRVDARGLGHERTQPGQVRSSGFALVAAAAMTLLGRLRATASRAQRHALFRPTVALVALGVLALFIAPKALFAAPFLLGTTLSEGQHAGEFIYEERVAPALASRDNVTVLSGQNLKAGAVIGRVNKGVGRVSTPAVVGTGNGTVSLVYAGPDVVVGNYVVTCKTAVGNGGVFSVVNPNGKALPDLTMTPGAGGTTVYTSREINFSITDGGTDFIVNDAFTFVVSTTAPVVIGTGNGTISGLSLGPDAIPGNYRVECITAVTNGGTFKVVAPDGDEVAVGSIVAGAGGTLVLANQRQLNLTVTDGATDFAVGDAFNVCVFNQLVNGKVVAWDPTTFDGRDDAAGILYDNVDATSGDLPGVIVSRDAAVIKSVLIWGAAITAEQKESAYGDLLKLGIVCR
jgi:hypothetical protein